MRLQLMNVTGLSRDNVASHLQKHRLGLKRGRTRKRRDGTPSSKSKSRRKASQAANASPSERGNARYDTAAGGGCDDSYDPHLDQAGGQWGDVNELNEREGSNPRANDGTSDPGRGNDGSNGREGDDQQDCSDDGAGAGSDNRNSACVETAPAHCAPEVLVNRHTAAATVAMIGAQANAANAVGDARPSAPSPDGQQQGTPDYEGVGSGAGSNGEGKNSGSAPASAGGASRVGSSRGTVASGNAAAAAAAAGDVGSRDVAAAAPSAAPHQAQ